MRSGLTLFLSHFIAAAVHEAAVDHVYVFIFVSLYIFLFFLFGNSYQKTVSM
jgi:hypothetical protein